MPEQNSFCAICLSIDRNLKAVEERLINFHDELCNFSILTDRQRVYCSECEWNLRKFRKFRQRCRRAHDILQTLQRMGRRYGTHAHSNRGEPLGQQQNEKACEQLANTLYSLGDRSLKDLIGRKRAHDALFFQKQFAPPTLNTWDGRNTKTYCYVYCQGKDNQNLTNDNIINVLGVKNCDYKIRVKQFPNVIDSESNMSTELELFSPIISDLNCKIAYSIVPLTVTVGDGMTSINNNDNVYTDANAFDDVPCMDTIDLHGDSNGTDEDPLALDIDNKDDINLLVDNDDKDNAELLEGIDDNGNVEWLDIDDNGNVEWLEDIDDNDNVEWLEENDDTKDGLDDNVNINCNRVLHDNDFTNNVNLLSETYISDNADVSTANKIREDTAITDSCNIIKKYAVKKTATCVNNKSTNFKAKTVPDVIDKALKPVDKTVFEINNKATGLIANSKTVFDTNYKVIGVVPEASNEVLIFTEPEKGKNKSTDFTVKTGPYVINKTSKCVDKPVFNTNNKAPGLIANRNPVYDFIIKGSTPEDSSNISISKKRKFGKNKVTHFVAKASIDAMNKKSVEKIVFDTNNKANGSIPKIASVADNIIAATVPEASNEVLVFTEPNVSIARESLPKLLRNIGIKFISKRNNKENENSVPIRMKEYHGPKLMPLVKVKNGDSTNNNINTGKIILDDEYVCSNVNINVNSNPRLIKKNEKYFKRNLSQPQRFKRSYKNYIQIVNGKITLIKKKNGILIKVPKKKKKLTTKVNVKKSSIKFPKLSKEQKDYLNLLSFVKTDKKQPRIAVDKKPNESSKKETEADDNVIESQNTDNHNLTENISDLGSEQRRLQEDEKELVSLRDLIGDTEFKTDASVCENRVMEMMERTFSDDLNDTTKKTLTELTNVDIGSEDQEIKIMYVCNPAKTINENIILQTDKKDLEFAPDTAQNEEIIECCEVHDYVNNCDTETDNLNKPDTTNENMAKTEQEKKITEGNYGKVEKIESKDKEDDPENLSSKFPGTLMERKVYYKLRKLFKLYGEIKTADGNVINIDSILNFYADLSNEDKWQLAKVVAGKRRPCTRFPEESIDILWKVQQKGESDYASVFDIVYLNTEEKVLREFLQRRTYARYVKAQYKCELCITPFPNQKSLEYHKKCHDPSRGERMCNLCQTRYSKPRPLYKHTQTHKVVYKCKLCPLITHFKPIMIDHFMNHKGMRLTCEICGQSYRYGSAYKQHVMLHSTSHECNMCARNFVSDLGLSVHKRLKHPNEDVMQSPDRTVCEVCNITYVTRKVYMKHYRNVHDLSATMPRSVRRLGAKWRSRLDPAERKKNLKNRRPKKKIIFEETPQIAKQRGPRKTHNFVETPAVDSSGRQLIMMHYKPYGQQVPHTFAAETLALQPTNNVNILGETSECYDKIEHIVAASTSDIKQEMNHMNGNEIKDTRNRKRRNAPSYEEVTRAIEAIDKTVVGQYYYEVRDENCMESEENLARDSPHFDAVTNEAKLSIGREFGQHFDKVILSSDVRVPSNQGNTASRTELPKMTHTVDAPTHTITINKRKQGRDMPQLIDTHEADAPNSNFVTHHVNPASGRNVKGGKRRTETPDMPQVFDTMTSRYNERGKRRPRTPDMPQVFDTMSRDNTVSSKRIKGGRGKLLGLDNPQVNATMTNDMDAGSSINTEYDNNMSHFDFTPYDDADAGSRRSMYAGKRRPELPQFLDTRNRETEQEPAPSVETCNVKRMIGRDQAVELLKQ